MPRRFSVWACVIPFVLAQASLPHGALAQQPSGRAVGVIPDASALRPEGRQVLAVEQPVYMGDRIQTGPSGEAQINFVDSTRLVVGPASSLFIDSSVLRNQKTMSRFVVSALRGTFRFISGNSPKPAYAIRTPTATIGVRGTEFDFAVLPDGRTEFVLFRGQAQVCDRSGSCVVLRGSCNAISVPRSGPIQPLSDREDRNARLRANFPYVQARNASLRPEFRTDIRTCGNIAAAPPSPDAQEAAARASPAPPPTVAPPSPAPPARTPSRPDPAPRTPPAKPDQQPTPVVQPQTPTPTPTPTPTLTATPVAPLAPAPPPDPVPPANPRSKGGHKGDRDHGKGDGGHIGGGHRSGRDRDAHWGGHDAGGHRSDNARGHKSDDGKGNGRGDRDGSRRSESKGEPGSHHGTGRDSGGGRDRGWGERGR